MVDTTWLYRHGLSEERNINGCVIAFNPKKSVLIEHQAKALAEELQYSYKIYENARTDLHVLTASQLIFDEGYERVLILTSLEEMVETETLIKECYDFEDVQAFVEVVQTPVPITELGIRAANKQRLQEVEAAAPATPPANPQTPAPQGQPQQRPQPVQQQPAQEDTLLIVGVINANPPVKGHGQMIQEILNQRNGAEALVKANLPWFQKTWETAGKKVQVRIVLRPGESGTNLPLSADGRSTLLARLYGAEGCGKTKINPPIENDWNHFFLGNSRENLSTTIQNACLSSQLNVGAVLAVTPTGQLGNVETLLNKQSQASLNKNGKGTIPVLGLTSGDVDACDTALVAAAIQIAKDSSIEKITNDVKSGKPPAPEKPQKFSFEESDLFTLEVIQMIYLMSGPKGDQLRNRVLTTKDDPKTSLKEYFKSIWDAIPEGDKIFIKDVGEGTGVGDLVSVIKDVAKLGAAVAGGNLDKNKEKTLEQEKRWKEIVSHLSYDPRKALTHPQYAGVKAKLDV